MTAREIDWSRVRRVLVIKLRSIGDTVLATPSLIALKRFLPHAEIDILLEDWVAPILSGFDSVDHIITTGDGTASRLSTARKVRERNYDVVFNLHGGTTSTLFVIASGAPHRVGYANYRWARRYNHLLASPETFWGKPENHSAEQQLALLGFVGVPVDDRPKSRLVVDPAARRSVLDGIGGLGSFALMHPTAAFATKQWPTENFARAAEFLSDRGIRTVAVATKGESRMLSELKSASSADIRTFDDLTLPEITALASEARVFVGNDSGIAHIAAAVSTPSVVIFGSSNQVHWRPWTDAPNEIVSEPFACQPCAGFECKQFGEPKCILSVPVDKVLSAIDRILRASENKKSGTTVVPLQS
jgi:lipopolysaccharide heptosyltransferase II